jgi:hypothetical protein
LSGRENVSDALLSNTSEGRVKVFPFPKGGYSDAFLQGSLQQRHSNGRPPMSLYVLRYKEVDIWYQYLRFEKHIE